jgi:Fe-coproporphyrin III synthase
MGIHPDGRVTPCLFLPDEFVAGSVRDAPLWSFWDEGASFLRLRDNRPGATCRDCSLAQRCGGGCRVRALAAYGDLRAPDSYCALGGELAGSA